MPRYIPFKGMTIDFCEATCTLGNPVSVRDLDATLYDLSCLSDHPNAGSRRVLILRQTDWQGRWRLSWIDKQDTLSVVPCPQGPN